MSQWEESAGEEESSFVSMADMMVGLLLIFIILLTYYVLQTEQEKIAAERVQEVERAARESRGLILAQIERRVTNEDVTFDYATGAIRFSENVLSFGRNQSEIPETAEPLLREVADALAETVPCLASLHGWDAETNCDWLKDQLSERGFDTADFRSLRPDDGTAPKIWIDGVYIEGHTDCVPFGGEDGDFGNWVLGAQRAGRTYLFMTQHNAALGRIFSKDPTAAATRREAQRVLGVASYADRRPARPLNEDGTRVDPRLSNDFRAACGALASAENERNRRIDIRISMGWTTEAETAP